MRFQSLLIGCMTVFLLCANCSAAWQICDVDGCIALRQDGQILHVSTTPISLLPEADRALLQYRLHFPTAAAASRLMEDLCS